MGQNDIPNVTDMATVNVLIMFNSAQSTPECTIEMHHGQSTMLCCIPEFRKEADTDRSAARRARSIAIDPEAPVAEAGWSRCSKR
jgi:hypothetical protein